MRRTSSIGSPTLPIDAVLLTERLPSTSTSGPTACALPSMQRFPRTYSETVSVTLFRSVMQPDGWSTKR